MEPKYTVIQLHPVPVCQPEEEYIIYDKTLKFINSLSFDSRGKGHGDRTVNSYILKSKELRGLKNFIEKHIDFYAHDLLKVSRKYKFYITQSWFNINRKGEDHHTHWHANSLISGVFYIAGDECPIYFENYRKCVFGDGYDVEVEEANEYNGHSWWVPNSNFKLLLFPSHVKHFVLPNESDTPRISLAVNTFIKGRIGQEDKLTEVFFK